MVFGILQVVREIEENGGEGLFIAADVRKAADCRNVVDRAVERFGTVDVLFNNAGVFHPKTIPECTEEEWDETIESSLRGAFLMSKYTIPGMIEQGGGAYVNISSMNALEPRAPYPMSMLRAALHSFSKLYGDRYARYNIRMNNLMPGFCENVNLSEFARKSIPAQRAATFEEIGQTCVFLASHEARYINGQSILSDGGMNRAVR